MCLKIGDLVRYRGWEGLNTSQPMAVIVDQRSKDSSFHHRVRVMWVGEEIPIQASAISTTRSKISSWVHPKVFKIVC
jgi:hypothetical protein